MRVGLKDLKVGQYVFCRFSLGTVLMGNWRYADECGYTGAGFLPETRFRIAEIQATPPKYWIRLVIPGSDPEQCLKLSGEELANTFELAP